MKKEYVGSVILIALGKNLNPEKVSTEFGLKPDQKWKRGDQIEVAGNKTRRKHSWGGWKKFCPKSISKKPIEPQLKYWIKKLKTVKNKIRRIRSGGNVAYLDVYATTSGTVTMIWDDQLIKAIGDLGLEIKFNFWAE